MKMSSIAIWYSKRNRRERTMLLCIAAAILLLWFTNLLDASANNAAKISELERKLETARAVVGQHGLIDARYSKLRGEFDASKTVGALALQVEIEKCASTSGTAASLSSSSSKVSGDFLIHSITLTCRNAKLASLAMFERDIFKLKPYLSIAKCSYEGKGKGDITAVYIISSFEPKTK